LGVGWYNIGMNTKRTQIARKDISAPLRFILDNGYGPKPMQDVFHFGEGKAVKDTVALKEVSPLTWAYDPYGVDEFVRDESHLYAEYHWIFSGYVFNTLTESDRVDALQQMLGCLMPDGLALVAVRTDAVKGVEHDDGVITKRGTFQTQLDRDGWLWWFSSRSGLGFISTVLTSKPGYCIIRIRRIPER